MQLHEALGRLDKLPLHENTTVSAVELGKFIDDAVSNLRANPDEGATWYKYLDGSLGIAIGWEDGYDTESGYEIAAKICNLDSDFMKEYDFLTMPYNKDTGDVWDTSVSNPSSADASWFIKELNAISDAVDKGELVTEGVNVNKHSSRRRSLTERGLTKAERHNRSMEKISNNYKAQQEKYKKFLASKGVSEEDIAELDRNSGLHGNALGAKAHKMASADEWNKLHEPKSINEDNRTKKINLYVNGKYICSSHKYARAKDFIDAVKRDGKVVYAGMNKDGKLSDNVVLEIKDTDKVTARIIAESFRAPGKKRKINECVVKINKILRRLNEAPMSDEDREDTQKLQKLAQKIKRMDGRANPSKQYTDDEIELAKKYNLKLPQKRGDYLAITDNDTKGNITDRLVHVRAKTADVRNNADWVRKNKERSTEDDGYGFKERRYSPYGGTPLEQDRNRDAVNMSSNVHNMKRALRDRKYYNDQVEKADKDFEKAVRKAVKDRDWQHDYYSKEGIRSQNKINDILANAKKRNKNESLTESEDGVSKWVLVDYYDVWGNADDGWEVNNVSREDEITISDDASDEEIFEYLRDTVKYFNKSLKFEDVYVTGDDDIIEFEASADGMPICRLERIRELANRKAESLKEDKHKVKYQLVFSNMEGVFPQKYEIYDSKEEAEAKAQEYNKQMDTPYANYSVKEIVYK